MRRVASALALVALIGGCRERAPSIPGAGLLDARLPDGSTWVPSSSGRGGSTTRPRIPSGCHARILVIFDRSGSMGGEWSDTGEQKWRVAATALASAIEPLADHLTVGAILFPSLTPGADGCWPVDPIEASLPFTSGASMLAAWEGMTDPLEIGGSTPIDTAFARADEALDDGDGTPTAVVLLTDGQPTCSERPSAIERAAAWHARGISTHVVGLPGAHGTETLDAIARAGGTDAALSVDEPAALTDRLSRIATETSEQGCR